MLKLNSNARQLWVIKVLNLKKLMKFDPTVFLSESRKYTFSDRKKKTFGINANVLS